ncbi:MAG: hypothetical protein DSY43_06520 [Gammaproteobacteria bacterium]|nr:MAG: hypothetical protein DSY43_06520 [Gammaproteobacteria bacterium]
MLIEIEKCIKNRKNFAIETTLASKNYIKLINRLKQNNWRVQMLYLYLPNINLSIDRVAERVKNGGHNIRLEDIKRRYNRSIENLINDYFLVTDSIICIGNENHSELIFNKNKDNLTVYNQSIMDEILRVKNVKR